MTERIDEPVVRAPDPAHHPSLQAGLGEDHAIEQEAVAAVDVPDMPVGEYSSVGPGSAAVEAGNWVDRLESRWEGKVELKWADTSVSK
jgi:hypothetical protein